MKENDYLSVDSSGVYDLAPVIKELNRESDALMRDFVLCKALISNKFAMDKIGHHTLDVCAGEYFYYPKFHAERSNGITVEISKDPKKLQKELEGNGVAVSSHLDDKAQSKVRNTNEVSVSKEKKRKKAMEEI